jgi:hypothetical protein
VCFSAAVLFSAGISIEQNILLKNKMILHTFDNQKYVISQYLKSQFALFSFFLTKKNKKARQNSKLLYHILALRKFKASFTP